MYWLKVWITRGSILTVAPVVEFASRFARTVILSRLLIPDEFGTAVAISVMLGTAALVTDISIEKYVVLKGGDGSAQVLAAVHVLSLIRGALLTLVLILLAPSIAAFFGVRQFSESFAIAGLVPFLASFAHLGIKQVQREHNYTPETIAQLFAHLIAVVSVIFAVHLFGDHRAMVASFLTEAVVYVTASHFLAGVPYQVRPDRATFRSALSFGFPLMLNGLGLAAMAQLDRALVGTTLGLTTLAKYAVILNLSTLPISIISRVFGTMALSYLIADAESQSVKDDRYSMLVFISAALSTIYTLFVAVTLDVLAPSIFGPSYSVAPSVHLFIVAIVFFRLQRICAPTALLLALGKTGRLAIVNLSAGFGIVFATIFVVVLHWSSFESILFGLLLGEFISFVFVFLGPGAGVVRDVFFSMIPLTAIVGTLAWKPEIDWHARGTLILVGLLGVSVQIAFGVYVRWNAALFVRARKSLVEGMFNRNVE
jgi:O-antigen/teichoic acid export membrane protein